MIVPYIQGRLGNQMLQVAAAASLAIDNNDELYIIDGQCDMPLGGNSIEVYKNSIFSKVKFKSNYEFPKMYLYNEPKFSYTKIPYRHNMIIHGYFASEKYFIKNSGHIKTMFAPKENEVKKLKEDYPFIFNESCCSVHLRFGDYLKYPSIHPIVSYEYISNGLELINDYDRIVCFSDNIEMCKQLLSSMDNVTYLNAGVDYMDMYAMSFCSDNIIANSTFSWWGAWLNANSSKRVVAPKRWFGVDGYQDWQDIYCNGWKII